MMTGRSGERVRRLSVFEAIGITWLLTYPTLLGAIGEALGRTASRRRRLGDSGRFGTGVWPFP
jgi:hypothetical protein